MLRPQLPDNIFADRIGSATGRKRALNCLATRRALPRQLAERRLIRAPCTPSDIPLRRQPAICKRLSAEHSLRAKAVYKDRDMINPVLKRQNETVASKSGRDRLHGAVEVVGFARE